MNLKEVAIVIEQELKTEENFDGYISHFPYAEILNGGCLASACGFGKTRIKAQQDLAKSIAGRILVTHAYSTKRKEIRLPPKITLR